MEEKIAKIKSWLGTGSINIFGLPMAGKDTQGIRLAEALEAKFLSSGMIIREMEKQTNQNFSEHGILIPTDLFYEWVLPYLERRDLFEYPLILSSIGRWSGEENQVLHKAETSGHDHRQICLQQYVQGLLVVVVGRLDPRRDIDRGLLHGHVRRL